MTLAQAERALDQIATRERHMMHVVNLIGATKDRAEAARLLRLANDMRIEARDLEFRALEEIA